MAPPLLSVAPPLCGMKVIFNGRNFGQHLNTGVTNIDSVARIVNVVLIILTGSSVCVCQGMNPSLQGIGISEMVLRGVLGKSWGCQYVGMEKGF